LSRTADEVGGWYGEFAASLVGEARVPDPLATDEAADGRLVDAVARDLGDAAGHATETGVKVIWTGDHLDAVRRLQETLAPPARTAVEQHALRPSATVPAPWDRKSSSFPATGSAPRSSLPPSRS
jgi:hypothetical protein